ncbi:MAG: coenzyme F420-0:L-glutamate ligase [Candidatus Methanoperedens sp.]|nr:coenzyme F420-0:L-glutamate ligase [Candidatus Methanoperedens sp.]
MNVTAFTVLDIPLIKPGDDLAGIIHENADLEERDIIAISSTIVSKSENRIISLNNIDVTGKAQNIAKNNGSDPRFVQAALNESTEILLESPFLLVRIKNGSICVNAGIDRSNVEGKDNILLLPEKPDRSAREIKDRFFELTGYKVSVVIIDTNGRAFRCGQTGAAIGIAGIKPTVDWRGTHDLFGNVLEVKNEAVVDEIAGFANVLMGEGNGGTPVAIIRGLDLYSEKGSMKDINRPEHEDVIREAILKSRSV